MNFLLLYLITFIFITFLVLHTCNLLSATYRKRLIMRKLVGKGNFSLGSIYRSNVPYNILCNLGCRIMPKKQKELDAVFNRLKYAGFRDPESIHLYYGFRLMSALVLGGLALIFFYLFRGLNIRAVLYSYLLLLAGYFLPAIILKHRVTQRKHKIFTELPDALDVLLICLDAGLSFNNALGRVGDELSCIALTLSKEFEKYFHEVNSGLPKRQALENLADRNGSECLTSMVNVLIQSSKFGTDISQAMGIHADSLRKERLRLAEEKGTKVSTKLAFPLVMFILPALMIVISGAAIIRIMDAFKKVIF